MANFTKTKTPYEFLVRWSPDGTLSGAHVGFRTITKEDGVVIADVVEPVVPVAVGLQSGFPLADILKTVQSGMKDKGAAFMADIADAQAKQAEAEAAKAAVEAAIAAIPTIPVPELEPATAPEIMKLTKEGMYFKGVLVEDAGEAYQAFMAAMTEVSGK